MTLKAALAGLPLGDGKAVIVGDPRRGTVAVRSSSPSAAQWNICVRPDITGEDVGTAVADLEEVRRETRYVSSVADGSGDPSPMTALGVLQGIREAVRHRYGADSLDGFTVAVQGLGHVGVHLGRLLHDAGAQLFVSDLVADRVQRAVSAFGAVPVEPEAIAGVETEVFATNALVGR